ncbi:unnamed protein product [Nyctereutes procyonoides]|uniref:(raccoon dog) hypothetical protein n=1 Tax=Nyctereutes procyonoides TaxID=34880 RepID=A0A811ZR16_NYCPR|nr:unnamed protein product [Nyctereutes procyonoides]
MLLSKVGHIFKDIFHYFNYNSLIQKYFEFLFYLRHIFSAWVSATASKKTVSPKVPLPQIMEPEIPKLLLLQLYESLCNPKMASCIQWIDKTKGIFHFGEKRKGNQKMARALRNYTRTGEITKIQRKLIYQFREAILQRLSPSYFLEKEIFCSQYVQLQQGYLSLSNQNANYNCTYANYHELSHPDY